MNNESLEKIIQELRARQAIQDVFRDHDFLAETQKLGLFVNARQTGDDVLARIRGAYAMPAPIIERLRKLSNQ